MPPSSALRVLCLRPERDFLDVGVTPPADLDVAFVEDERAVTEIASDFACLVLPSAGPSLAPEMFRRATGLRLVQYTGAGVDRIAGEVLDRLACPVCNVPGASAPDVASYVVVTAGSLLRRLQVGDRLVKSGRYVEARAELAPALVRGFRGLHVGIVGFGAIGREVAKLFTALGSDVRWFDPAPAPTDELVRYERSDLDELLRWCELLTVHVPLTGTTRGLLGEAELAKLPRGALVVNAARGGVIDEPALVQSLESGQLGGLVLDVYEQEPLPPSAAILDAAARHSDRVLLTPHIAGVTPEASRRLFDLAWSNVHATLTGRSRPACRVR